MNMFASKRYIALAAIILALSGAAWGQTWDGGAFPDTSWSNGTNWNPDLVPLPGQNTTIGMNATITVTGDQTITDVTVQGGMTVIISIDATRTLTILGTLTNDGTLTITGDGDLIAASTTNNGSLTTSGTGTRSLGATTNSGTGTITVGAGTLTTGALANSGTVAVGANTLTSTSIAGTGSVSISTGTINAAGTISALTVAAGPANLNGTGLGLTVGGNPGGALATSGTVNLQGNTFTSITNTGALTLSAATATLSGNLTINAGSATANALTVNGDVTGAGTFNGQAGAIDIDGNVTVANFRASSTTTTVDGNFQPTTMFNAYGGTMVFDTTANSAITTTVGAYNNVSLSAAKRPTAGTLTINGTLGLTAAGVLDLATNNAALSVAGPTTNGGTITGGSGALTFNGTVTTSGTITGGSGALTFGNDATDQVTNTGVITAGSTDVIFRGNYVGGGGTLNAAGAGLNTQFYRNASLGTFTHNNGTVLFSGGAAQSVTMPTAGNFNALTIDKTGGTWSTATGAAASTGTLTLSGAGTVTFTGDFDVTGSFSNPIGSTVSVALTGNGTTITPAATFNTSGTVTIGDNTADTITFDGGFTHTTGPTSLAGNLVTTNDAVVFYDGVTARTLTINANSTITTGAAGNNITAHTIARGGATAWTLGLTAGTGDIEITGAVGAGNALGALSMTSSGTIQANSTIDAASVGITGGAVDLNGNVTAPGGFSSSGTTFDNTGATITTTGTDIVIDHTTAVTIGAALTSGAGDIDIDTAGLTTVTDAGDITTTTGNVTFGASGTGDISTAGEITTGGGNIVFTRDTTITSAVTITTGAGAGNISFMAVLDGVAGNTDTLSLTAGTGSVTFSDTVGNGEPLGSLTVTSAGAAITANNTINSQTVNLTGGPVDLNNTVTAPGGFTSAGTTFDNTGATITTTGTLLRINHTGAITIGAALASGAGNIDIDSTGSTVGIGATVTTSTGAITIDADGLTTVTALVSATGNGSVAFAGTLAGALSLGADVTTVGGVAGGNISFGRPVTLTADVAVSTGPGTGNITFGAASSITAAAIDTQSLTLTAGTGSISFGTTDGECPIGANRLEFLTVNSANNVTFNSTVAAGYLLQSTGGAAGNTIIRQNVTTTEADGVSVTNATITLDGLTIDTTAGAGADIDLAGAVTLSTDTAILTAANDITITGAITGAQELRITGAVDVNLNNTVNILSLVQTAGSGTTTLLNNVTTSGDNGVNIATAIINLDRAAPQTIQANGTGIARFNGAVTLTGGSTTSITTNNGPISFLSTVDGGDALTVTAGTNNDVTFGTTAGERVGETTPLDSLTVTGGNVAFYGIGNGANGVTGTVQVTAAGLPASAINLYGDNYQSGLAQTWTATPGGVRYRATANGTWQAGGAGISCPATDLYLDHSGQTLMIVSPLSCRSLYFYRGILSCGGTTFTIAQNLVIFGLGYSADDPEWTTLAPSDTRYAYFGTATLPFFPNGGTYNPANGLFTAAPNATFSIPINAIFNVSGNFYVNGSDMSDFTLNVPANGNNNPQFNSGDVVSANQWGTTSYAVAFNMTVANSVTPGGWIAASTNAQGVTNGLGNGNWQFARPIIRAARTIYDNILHITFEDDLTNSLMNIENSSGQITAAISAAAPGGIFYDGGTIRFDAVSVNPDGTGGVPLADTSSFYLRHTTGSWNTDATGSSAGAADSTNRSNAHRTTVPDLSFLKGLLYAADGKTMIQNYGNHGVAVYNGTTDGCRPTLVEVRTGQEQHDPVQANQYPYDAHNFIEFRYSEPVYIGGFDALVAAANWPIPYARAQDSFAAIGDWGGAIEISGSDLEIVGYATIDTGVVNTGTRGDYAGGVSPDLSDTTIHGLYRDFSVDGNPANFATQDHRLRIAIAGWCEETLSPPNSEPYKWFYQGFINNATLPSGTVHVLPNNFIRDRAATPNVLEHQSSIAAGYGDSEYAKAAVTVNNGTADLYGPWDTTRPVFAGVMPAGSWGTGPTYHEAIPQASLAGNVNRLEMHFFDNEVPYTIPLYQYQWVSRSGWFTPTSLPIQTAPETFGGSRPDDGTYTRPTSGGVRDSSFVRANEGAFTVTNVTVAETASTSIHLPGFLTRVSSVFFNLTLPLDVADDPYQTILIDEGFFTWPIAAADLRVSYSAFPAAGGGFVTDLAGNLLSTVAPLTCLDRAPPQVVLTLAGVNRNEVLVLFSKNMSAGTADAGRIRIRLTDGGGPDDVIPASVTFNPLTPRILRFTFPDSVSAEHILNAGSIIWFETGNWQPNPETGIPEDNTYYGDIAGNFVPVGETHRLTDLGIGILDVLFASDGVNADGVFGAGEGALRVFDGTGSLLDRNVTIGTRLTSGMASPLPLTMYFDANPGAATAPNLFNSAANAESRLWLPSVLPGFNLMGNGAARSLAPDAILNGLQTLRNFTIPEADTDMEIGNSMDMVFRYGGLFCVRLDDETDIASVAPWTFRVSETRKQRGGVTILNNVIDSNRRERTMLRVELPRAGNLVIQVFTLDGNLVRVLERNRRGGGTYTYEWDGTNAGNRPVARGMYFIRVVGPDIDEIRKVMVVKE